MQTGLCPERDDLSTDVSSVEFTAPERRVLSAINQRVAAAQSLDEVMNFLFDTTRAICPCDRIGLAFLEDNGHRVAAHWARADYEPLVLGKGFSQDLNETSLKAVLESGQPRIIDDLEQYLREHPQSASTRAILNEGVRSNMTCPLVVEGRPVGFLFRSSRQPHAYNEHQVRVHQAIGERLSQAVEKAWRIEQLAAANRAYFEMLGFVSHELRSPVASLVMDAEALLQGHFGPLQPDQHQKIERMIGKGHFLLGLVGEYLNLSKIESDEFAASIQEDVDFKADVILPSIDLTQGLMDQRQVKFVQDVPEGPLHVQCDPGLLIIVLVNLLGNAVKYGEEQGEVRLRVEHPDGRIRVSVWNQGPGFPPAEQSKLFRRFSRLQTPELLKRKGTGVGLYTAWRVVQMHGGRIWAHSEPAAWAEFVFELPQPVPAAR